MRNKAYRFEQVLTPMPERLLRDTPMRRLQALAERIAKEEAPRRWQRLRVVAGDKGWRGSSYCFHDRIELIRRHRCVLVLLHELAHWLEPSDDKHGARFMRTYTYLLCRYGDLKRRWLNEAWRKVTK